MNGDQTLVFVLRFRDPGTVEYCDRCRCKTDHVTDVETDERLCIYHLPRREADAVEEARRRREETR
jgi:hypothetical protein